MAVFNTVSCRMVLAKIARDYRPKDDGWVLDCVEWMAEALGLIGAYTQYARKTKDLVIEDHKARLPSDLVQIEQVGYMDPTLSSTEQVPSEPLRYAGSTMYRGMHSLGAGALVGNAAKTYTLSPPYIHTEMEQGFVRVSYLGTPVDEDGWPLIPDEPNFHQALSFYCLRQMMLGGFKPALEDLRFEVVDRLWQRYCGQARDSATFPSLDQMEALKRSWVSLVTDSDKYTTFFAEEYENPRRPAENEVTSTADYFGPQQVSPSS